MVKLTASIAAVALLAGSAVAQSYGDIYERSYDDEDSLYARDYESSDLEARSGGQRSLWSREYDDTLFQRSLFGTVVQKAEKKAVKEIKHHKKHKKVHVPGDMSSGNNENDRREYYDELDARNFMSGDEELLERDFEDFYDLD